MGNAGSTAIRVQCEHLAYYDGDVVRGVVCYNGVAPVETCGIELTVKGRERTKLSEEIGGSCACISGSKTPFKVSVNLAGSGTLPPGQQQFPFLFTLPAGLPPSFRFKYVEESGTIKYKVKVKVVRPGAFNKNITHKQELQVLQRLTTAPQPVHTTAEGEVTYCCCIRHGHVWGEATLDKQLGAAGDNILLSVQADNQSSERLKDIEVKLMRYMELRTSTKGGSRQRSTHCALKRSLPGIPPYTSLRGNLARRLVVQLPPGLLPSVNSQLITCKYEVLVVLHTRCCAADIKLKVPFSVTCRQSYAPSESLFTEPPEFWKPDVVAAPVTIPVPSAPPPAAALEPSSAFWANAVSYKDGKTGWQHQGQ